MNLDDYQHSSLSDGRAWNETDDDSEFDKGPLIINGGNAEYGEFPWVARVYIKEEGKP